MPPDDDADSRADAETVTAPPSSAQAGLTIGPYRLLQRLGEGGMGEVWLAEQTVPVKRQVAVKIIKLGMDSAQVLARFEAERQALALMDHQAISTIFDGGTTPGGRPYFAMEYVKGEPITTYCDRHRLSVPDRLAIFIEVCRGVQHAHQKGIIHRDLKPSNVLVTLVDNRPVPKIIDFGVAKATAQSLTDLTLFTELGVMIGTPEYMSPEQAEMGGLDVDTRTDVYSLGVLLYQLLTSVLPFDGPTLRKKSLDDIRRTIREVDPPKPSTRVLREEPGEPRRSSRLIGDLDWITMKALEKDRTRRYETVGGLAEDIRRHLNDEPVTAGPPSGGYRARKFVRRHRFGVTTAAAVVVLLMVFGAAMARLAGRIAVERDRANDEAARANREAATALQVSDFLAGLFEASDPSATLGQDIPASVLLARGVDRIEADLGDQPEVQVRLLRTISSVYGSLGQYATSLELAQRALARSRGALGDLHEETARAASSVGVGLIKLNRVAEAEPYLREALAGKTRLFGASAAETITAQLTLGTFLYGLGRFQESEQLLQAVVVEADQVLGRDEPLTLSAIQNLAVIQHVLEKFAEAESNYQRSLERRRRLSPAGHPRTLLVIHNLGELMVLQERLDDAERYLQEALTGRRKVLPPDHPDIADTLSTYAALRNLQGRFTEAETMLVESLAAYKAAGLAESGYGALAESRLGEALTGQKRYREAEDVAVHGGDGVLASQDLMLIEKRLAVERVVRLYREWGNPEKAAQWSDGLPAKSF